MSMPIDPKSAPKAFGTASLEFRGKTYVARAVTYDTLYVFAYWLHVPGEPEPDHQDSVFVTFVNGTPTGPIDQLYNKGTTDHSLPWAIAIGGTVYHAETGFVKGRIAGGYDSITVEATINDGNGNVGKFSFDARRQP